jgi:hypothetical protein
MAIPFGSDTEPLLEPGRSRSGVCLVFTSGVGLWDKLLEEDELLDRPELAGAEGVEVEPG